MVIQFLLSRKTLGKLRLVLNNPLIITCDKITHNPRTIKTSLIKEAVENINIVDIEEDKLSDLISSSISFIVKDFFLYMHQTGLYNRQFKLWETLAKLTSAEVFQVQGGIFKKKDLNCYIIDFFIDPKSSPSIKVIINNENKNSGFYDDFKFYLDRFVAYNFGKLKGLFYLSKEDMDQDTISKLEFLTEVSDPISKYESVVSSKNVTLNIINFSNIDQTYRFDHLFPDLKTIRTKEAIT